LTEEEGYSHKTRKRACLKRLGQVYAGFDELTKHRFAENIAKQLVTVVNALMRHYRR